MAKNQLQFTITTAGRTIEVKREQDIPAQDFQITGLEFNRWASDLPVPPAGEFQVLSSVTTLRSVFMQTLPGRADEGFAFLAQNTQLDRLQIDGSEGLSDGMVSMAKYIYGPKRLENLKLAHAPRLSGWGFANAAWLPSLKVGEFYFTGLEDAAVEALAGGPKLDRLVVSDTRITDIALRSLARAHALRSLSLEHSQRLTAGGLAEGLPRLGGLRELNANDTPFGDAAAAAISTTLTHLAKLHLRGCPLTDAGLAKLATMPSLRSLTVASTRVTPEGSAAFELARPDCLLER